MFWKSWKVKEKKLTIILFHVWLQLTLNGFNCWLTAVQVLWPWVIVPTLSSYPCIYIYISCVSVCNIFTLFNQFHSFRGDVWGREQEICHQIRAECLHVDSKELSKEQQLWNGIQNNISKTENILGICTCVVWIIAIIRSFVS